MWLTHPLLSKVAHRPWPAPARSWRWSQHWLELLFAHWRVPPARLAPLLPAGLTLDTWEGDAWVSVVPFRMARVRPRGLPPIGVVSDFLELNLRTYAVHDGKRGVYFLSIHAGKRLAAWLSRRLSSLAYTYAPMTCTRAAERSSFRCTSAAGALLLAADWVPRLPPRLAVPGSLDAWLVERYCLFAAPTPHTLVRGDIHHEPWLLHDVELTIDAAGLGQPFGLDLTRPPDRAHYSPGVRTIAWGFQSITGR